MLTDLEYRVWTQYLLSADDFGVMRLSALTVQADNDHLAHRPAKVILRCLEALVKAGLIHTFEHQHRTYAYQHDWQTWQKISYPRTTTQPAPTAEALAICDENTRQLFGLHPGGAGRTRKERSGNNGQPFQEHSGNIPETFQKDSPLMRAGAPAKRLTANGSRLEANGTRQTADAPMDVWWLELKAAYPGHRVNHDVKTQQAFVSELLKWPAGAASAWLAMRENLDSNKLSHEWRVKGMIPWLYKYLTDGRWQNALPADAPAGEQVSARTMRMLNG